MWFRKKKQTHFLSESIPFYSIEQETALSNSQCMSAYLELTMPEAYSLAEEELVEVYALFNQILRSIPDSYILHKQDYYNYANYKSTLTSNSFLATSFELKFNERRFMENKSYLIITKASNQGEGNNIMTNFIMGTIVKKEVLDGFPDFNNTVEKIQHILEEGGISNRRLEDREILTLINIYYNLGDSRILKDIQLKHDHLVIGGQDVVMYNSVAYEVALPTELNTPLHISPYFDNSFTFDLGIGFSKPHILNTIIRKPNKNRMIKILSAQRERTASLSFKSRENQMLVDEFDEYLSTLTESENNPVLFSQNLITWGDSITIKKTENEISNAMNKMNIYTQRNFNCGAEYWYNCPGNSGDLPDSAYQVQLSDIASFFMPIETNPKNTGVQGVKFVERRDGIPIIADLWDAPYDKGIIGNRNMFVLGPSGSGKSFLVNHLIRQYIEQGYHITMIDVGGSYERSCSYLGGVYFEYKQENKMSFNPFFVPIEKGQYIFRTDEELNSLKTLIITLWKGKESTTSQEESTTISTSLDAYFKYVKNNKLKSKFNLYYEFIRDNANTIFEKTELQWFNIDSFLHVLKPYYKDGIYDYLLNSDKEFSIADLQYCVFELDQVKNNETIFPVIILIIMDAFLAKMKKYRELKKIIFIEEAWSAMKDDRMIEFLEYLYRTVRKFNGAVCVITQQLDDLISNENLKEIIINNADIKFILDQSKNQNKIEKIKRVLSLENRDLKQILSMNKIPFPNEKSKDVYIRLGTVGKVYSVLVSLEEALMYDTGNYSPKLNQLLKENDGDHEYAIKLLIEELFPKEDEGALDLEEFADRRVMIEELAYEYVDSSKNKFKKAS